MARYIDAVKTAEIISEKCGIDISELVDIFAEISTADVEPVRHGKWVVESYDPREHISKCSCCGEAEAWTTKYCPNCGARMDKEN